MKMIIFKQFRILFSAFLICFPALSANPTQQDSNMYNKNLKKALSNAKRFQDIFEFVREIELRVDDIIGEITRLDVAPNGDLLVVDRMTHKTWLFDREGNLIKDINVENDYPGIKWLPRGGWFGQNKTILVLISGTHSLFLFDSRGKFIKAMRTNFPNRYRDFVSSNDGYIYGYGTAGGVELAVKKLNSEGEIVAAGGIFPKQYKNLISRSEGGGLVIDKTGSIYQYNACGPEIYKLSTDFKLLKTFDERPWYYKQLSEDLPNFAGDPAAFMKKTNQLIGQSTTTFRVHLLADSLLLIQYIQLGQEGGLYLNFCDLEGHYYTDNKIVSRRPPILAARKGLIYMAVQPEENEKGELPNPVIKEYNFRYEQD